MPPIELFQFAGSHFNEKARWALDLKRVEHERKSLMPGPHMRTMKQLTGATETPALVDGDDVVAGSTAILEHLERRFPQPALFPEDAAAALESTRGAFDFVAQEPGRTGYLVGDRFSVADLTCAALLMPCLETSEWGGPEDALTPKTASWRARWAEHPGAEWVREIFRRHRRA